ncbi:MAG: hypothetical protein EWM73_00905 [Nitrospira sp.]|nr:MAG: hypothetical protein EWM73_00905 [Nitrospira sp.]
MQRLRHQRFEIKSAKNLHSRPQRRSEHLSHPFEAVDHIGTVGAEPERSADSLIEVTERLIAMDGIDNHPHGHGRANGAGHRADGGMMVTGFEDNLTTGSQGRRACVIFRPSFIEDGADDGALHGTAHVFPGDGRTSMQDHTLRHIGEDLAGNPDTPKDRLG